MQYQLPQFVEAEDKIIGPLTLKQFIYLLAAGGLLFLYWSLFKVSVWFFLFALPTAIVAAIVTFGQFGGRPAVKYAMPMLQFVMTNREYVFHRSTHTQSVHKTSQHKQSQQSQAAGIVSQEYPESRLKRLAYVLDQRAREEEELLEKTHG